MAANTRLRRAYDGEQISGEKREPKIRDELSVFEKAIKEMSELGIERLEDYIAYKETGILKKPPQM